MGKLTNRTAEEATVDHYVTLLGLAGAFRLFSRLGGARSYVPKPLSAGGVEPKAASGLATVLTPAEMAKLSERDGGNYIRVPLARRFRVLFVHVVEGRSYRETALAVGMTENGVGRALRPPLPAYANDLHRLRETLAVTRAPAPVATTARRLAAADDDAPHHPEQAKGSRA